MLDKAKALNKSNEGQTTLYWFECGHKDCTQIIKVSSGRIKKSTGMCKAHWNPATHHYRAYDRLLRAAKARDISVELTFEEYKEFVGSECHYCGDDLKWTPTREAHYMDRYNNTKSYSADNCVACCGRCNKLKSTLNGDIFIEICKEIANYHA